MVTLKEIERARKTIEGIIHPTPLLSSDYTYHHRTSAEVPVGTSKVVLELETGGFDHIQALMEALKQEHYEVEVDPTCPVV